ncbi:Translation initiation factor 3 subunit c [Serendipita sp. 399]|nr:Translation initiation factor 3 subunit c [Serendipita sp. 399]
MSRQQQSRFFRTADTSESSSEESDEELLSSDDNAPAKPAAQTQQKQPMSRFLKTAGDSSSSSSSSPPSESEDSDDDDDNRPAPVSRRTMDAFRKTNAARDDDDSDSDDAPKTVKSAKDKKIEEMQTIGKAIDNAAKIADWVATSNEFEKLAKIVQKPTNVSEPVPPHWLRAIVSVEAALSNAKDKDPKKKINANVARALNGLKQRIKKVAKEYEEPLKKFNEDPEKFEKEYLLALEPPAAPKLPKQQVNGDIGAPDDPENFTTVGKGGKGVQHTSETIFKDLAQVNENRGKKNTDRVEQVRTLEKLLAVAVTTYQRIRVLLALIAARFDYNPAATHMPRDAWMSVQEELDQLVRLLIREPSYSVDEEVAFEYDEMVERSPETVKKDKENQEDGIVRIRGSIISFVDRLDDEFTRSLQNTDPHGTDYIERLRDEQGLYKTICLAEAFFEKTSRDDARARVIMRRLEHIYYKPDAVVDALEQVVGIDAVNRPVLSLQSCGNPQGLDSRYALSYL